MAYQVVGYTVADSNGGVSIASPVAFIVKKYSVYFGDRQSSTSTSVQSIVVNDASSGNI